jgi:hypothetical protein
MKDHQHHQHTALDRSDFYLFVLSNNLSTGDYDLNSIGEHKAIGIKIEPEIILAT